MSLFDPVALRLQIASDLRELLRLYGGLRVEAVNRAGDPDIPGGAAMVMLGPGADVEAFGYMQLSAIFGRIDEASVEEVLRSDVETPLSFLAGWSDVVREAQGRPPTDARATIAGEVRFLSGATDWMLSTDDEGDARFLPVDDFAAGLNRVVRALETVLHDGDRPTRINAECGRCAAAPRLCVRYGPRHDGSEDGWYCPGCRKDYAADGVRECWRQMLVRRSDDAPVWVSVKAAAAATGRSHKTIHRWTEPLSDGSVRVTKRPTDTRRIEVRWADVRAADDTSRRKPWQSAS